MLVIAILGVIHLAYPLGGDQALFALTAEAMQRGSVLYRDIYDVKQPGIFFFYQLAGVLFGFHEQGIHLLELFYQLAFTGVVGWTVGLRFRLPILGIWFAPLATVGAYYGVAKVWNLTQVEALAPFPIFLAMWWSLSDRRNRWFCSGLAAGVLVSLKLFYLPVVVAFWVVAMVWDRRGSRHLVAALAGLTSVSALLAAWAAWHGTLGILLWTTFVFPLQAVGVHGKGIGELLNALFWFATRYGLWVLFGVVAIGRMERVRDPRLARLLTVWFVAGLGLIILQRHSWWTYHFHLIAPAAGLLGLMGIDELVSRRWSGGLGAAAAALAAVVCLAPSLVLWSTKAHSFAVAQAAGANWRRVYQQRENPDYPHILEEVKMLTSAHARPGPIYVAGNPLYLFLSRREQAAPLNGWSLELVTPRQWSELEHDLVRSRPPYIYVDRFYVPMIPRKAPSLRRWIESNYRATRVDVYGEWYELAEGGPLQMGLNGR